MLPYEILPVICQHRIIIDMAREKKMIWLKINQTHKNESKIIFLLLLFIGFAGCDQSTGINVVSKSGSELSNNSQVTTRLARYTMPSEISAVPASNNDSATPSGKDGNQDQLSLPAAAEGTDYSKARTIVYVEEKTLTQFKKLESILNAVNQTKYEDEIGKGAYKAMVAFEEESDGRSIKKLETWVVQSDAVTEDEEEYLRVRAWIEKQFEEDTPLIKAEFKITSPPTINSDGSYHDYGEWVMNLKLDDTGEDDYFTASCTSLENGYSVIKLFEKLSGFGQLGVEGLATRVRAIMYRKASSGYGRVFFPDYESFFCPECDKSTGIPHKTVEYAYNKDFLAIEEDGNIVYKDRNAMIKMTHRYGLYDLVTGEDVLRTKFFGFPIRYEDSEFTKHAYYGAWQGRHEIWTHDGNTITEGTSVTRDDMPPDEEDETYTVGKAFKGILTKRTYTDAVIDEIQGIPVEVWMDQHLNLIYNSGAWLFCLQMNWNADPPECQGTGINFDDTIGFDTLMVGENNDRKQVFISGWDSNTDEIKQFVYMPATLVWAEGFYEAVETLTEFGLVFRPIIPRQALDTSTVEQLWVDISGMLFLEYKGEAEGWVEKELAYFDEINWMPVFDEAAEDKPFSFPLGQEIYINMQGTSYIVEKTIGDYTVKREMQTVINPDNALQLVPNGTLLLDPWDPDNSSTYTFITNHEDENYLMLVYDTIGENDMDFDGNPLGDINVGDIVLSTWGIETQNTGDQFNWEYYDTGEMGQITYLMDGENYKLLDDPLMFKAIEIENNAGESRSIVLEYDGWMAGLPDLYHEFEKAGHMMTSTISDKIINLPQNLILETLDEKYYVVKPLEISLFLSEVADPGSLDLTNSYGIDIYDVPIFKEHGMEDIPEIEDVKYSEGILVE